MIKVELTEIECDQLSKLIDSAIRAEGMPAAIVAVPIFHKLKDAYEANKKYADVLPAHHGV